MILKIYLFYQISGKDQEMCPIDLQEGEKLLYHILAIGLLWKLLTRILRIEVQLEIHVSASI